MKEQIMILKRTETEENKWKVDIALVLNAFKYNRCFIKNDLLPERTLLRV